MGGVGVALQNRDFMIEAAKYEWHGSSAAYRQDRFNPSDVTLVFGRHRLLEKAEHGAEQAKLEGDKS